MKKTKANITATTMTAASAVPMMIIWELIDPLGVELGKIDGVGVVIGGEVVAKVGVAVASGVDVAGFWVGFWVVIGGIWVTGDEVGVEVDVEVAVEVAVEVGVEVGVGVGKLPEVGLAIVVTR